METFVRSNQFIVQEAQSHFSAVVEYARRFGKDVACAEREKELGLRLVDAALALDTDGVLDLDKHLPSDIPRDDGLRLALQVLPYVGSSLRLLEMEFAHPDLGRLPASVVLDLLNAETDLEHAGVTLTRQTVIVQYRRLPAV